MRTDVLEEEVLVKCEILKSTNFWPSEPYLRPRAWLNNFQRGDRAVASFLLDRFSFYNGKLTDLLLTASFNSIGDGLNFPYSSASHIKNNLRDVVCTPVEGEEPGPTDSGINFCRKARQVLGVDDAQIMYPLGAIQHASLGGTVIFIDDFVGSGDQLIDTWKREYRQTGLKSFKEIYAASKFTAIYIPLVATEYGLGEIRKHAPGVVVCPAHVLTEKSTIFGLEISQAQLNEIAAFLYKYSKFLTPKAKDQYIANNPEWLAFGYKKLGLLFGFEHSIPDATLPVFWSPGTHNWSPLVERR